MFARFAEANAKPGKRPEITNILTHELLPLLRRQQGFVDVVGLAADTNGDDGAGLTFWSSRHDAETFYESAEYKKVMDRVKPLTTQINVRTFTVETSTFHKIAAGKAA